MPIWIAAANHWQGREGYRPRYVVLHGTAGFTTAQDVGYYFANPATRASTHYVIGLDGTIVQCVQEQDAAWGNGGLSAGHDDFWSEQINPNLLTISIEHVKPSLDNSDQLTDAQQQASFQLVREICQRWQIPMRRADIQGGITGHYSLDPVNRSRCPGPYPWDELFAFLQPQEDEEDSMLTIDDPFASTHFEEQDDGSWYCPRTDCTLLGAILRYYCRIQGAPRLPVTTEQHDVPEVVWQRFEAAILVYDPKHTLDHPTDEPCYMVKLDSPLARRLLTKRFEDAAQLAQTAQKNAEARVASLEKALQQAQSFDHNTLKKTLQSTQQALQGAIQSL